MYILIIIISNVIDIPETSPIIDDEEDMDEGAVNEGVGDEDVMNEEGTGDKVKDEEDRDEVMDEKV